MKAISSQFRQLSACFLAGAVLVVAALAAGAADAERGRNLHDTHCRMCHTEAAYKRDSKLAKSYEDVRTQVARWQTNSSLRWSDEDIDNVTAFLAKTYYGLPCPSC